MMQNKIEIAMVAAAFSLLMGILGWSWTAHAHGGGKDKHGCHREAGQRHCHIEVSAEQLKLRMEIEKLLKAIEQINRMPMGKDTTGAERACRALYRKFHGASKLRDHKPVFTAVEIGCWLGVKPGETR